VDPNDGLLAALRTLTLAYREFEPLHNHKDWTQPPEEKLTLLGIVGIMVSFHVLFLICAVKLKHFKGSFEARSARRS
jgi:hypothetical protein